MRTIGGYFSFNKSKLDPEQICSKLHVFQSSPNPEFASNSVVIEEYEYGHVFASRKEGVRSMITAAKLDNQDLFFCLGYLTMNNFEDWDADRATFRIPKPVPADFADLLTRAEGEFNAFYWDRQRRQLHIVNDRFAAKPLYILQTKERVFFCTNLPALLHLTKIPVKPDPLGMIQLFMFLHCIDTYTHVESVTRLRPASHMIISEKDVSCQPYWKLQYDVHYDLPPLDFSREVFSAFRKSVADRTRIAQHGLLALSGGLDSRLIAGCIPQPSRFGAFTVGSHNTDEDLECRCAAEISRVFGFNHQQILLPPSDLPAFSREIFMLTGNVTGMHPAAKFMRFPGMRKEAGFSGAPGDVMAGGYIPNLYYTIPSRTEQYLQAHGILHAGCINKLRQCFVQGLIDEYAPKMEALLRETYASVSGPTAAHKITAWKMAHYLPAFSCSGPFNSNPVTLRFYPHLGYAYNDLMLKLPALWMYNKAFYKYMIYQNLPPIRHVCYANTGQLLQDSIPPTHLPLISYKLWALKRRCKAFFHKASRIEPQQAFEFYFMQKNQTLWSDVDEILASYPELKTYLNITGIKTFIEHFKHIEPHDQAQTLDYINMTSFLTATLYFYKYTHEL